MNSTQGTESWHKQRIGKLTGSVIHSIMSNKVNMNMFQNYLQDQLSMRQVVVGRLF